MISKAIGTGPVAITAADFNNDNYPDIAVTSFFENTISVLLGDGYGSFNQQIKLSTGNNNEIDGIATGDLNNDKNLDIVVVSTSASNFGVFLGQGNGSFSQQTTYSTGTNSVPLELALGDLNGDNILDLVVSDTTPSALLIFLGNGNGAFTQTYTLSTGNNSGPYGIAINYFNKDSHLDIAVGNSFANNVGIFLGDGTGNFGSQTTYSTSSDPSSLVAADFNRDSVLDIATANYLGKNTSVLRRNDDDIFGQQNTFSTSNGSFPFGYGNRNFKKQKTYSTGNDSYPDDIAVKDFNGDSQFDFISANYITINDKSNIYSKESK
jgi:hypothetical protein